MSAVSTPMRPPRPASRFWRQFKRNSIPYLFLAPFLVGFLVFMVYPLIYALNMSMYRTRLVGGTTFVGLENYGRALQDTNFWDGVRNVLLFGLVQIPVMLGLALMFALILDSAILRRKTIFRLGNFLPFAVPSVVAALMWGYLYGESFGPIAQIARALGLTPPAFLTVSGVIPALANISTWQYTGYNMLILFAALQSIPHELYEAAAVDGASGVQIALKIRIPLIAPAVILTGIFSIIGTLQLFNEPNVLNSVAPSILNPHFTPNLYVYSLAFRSQQFDYSATMAFTLAFVTGVLASVFFFITRRSGGRQ